MLMLHKPGETRGPLENVLDSVWSQDFQMFEERTMSYHSCSRGRMVKFHRMEGGKRMQDLSRRKMKILLTIMMLSGQWQ